MFPIVIGLTPYVLAKQIVVVDYMKSQNIIFLKEHTKYDNIYYLLLNLEWLLGPVYWIMNIT